MSEAKQEASEKLGEVCEALRDYHTALDLGENHGVAAWSLVLRLRKILDMPWVQGAEQARRAEKIRSGK